MIKIGLILYPLFKFHFSFIISQVWLILTLDASVVLEHLSPVKLSFPFFSLHPFVLFLPGQRDEATNHGWVCIQQQVPAGAAAGQSAAFWWTVSRQAVSPSKKVRDFIGRVTARGPELALQIISLPLALPPFLPLSCPLIVLYSN